MWRELIGLCACLIALIPAGSCPASAQSARPPLATKGPEPPVAKKVPHVFEAFGYRRDDPYDWMRNTRELLPYLQSENAYADARLVPLQPLIEKLEAAGSERADESDDSPDFTENGYLYQRRTAPGARFPVIVRRKVGSDGAPEVVLDVESLAAGHPQYEFDGFAVSPDGNLVAFAVDFTGARLHQLFIRNITTGDVRAIGVNNAYSDLTFSADSRHLFYIRTEDGTIRAHQLWRHLVGTDASADKLLYEETDPTYELHLETAKSGRFILLTIANQQSSEVRYLAADRPDDPLTVMEPRRRGVFYAADHVADRFYIRTNLGAPNFRVAEAPETAPQAANWTTVVPETPGQHIAWLEVFDDFLAVNIDHDAVRSVRVFRRTDGREIPVPRPAGVSVMELFEDEPANRDPHATTVQLRLSAPNLPYAFHDFDTRTGELLLVKKSPAWDWFDPSAYEVRHTTATAPDGEAIPVTLMYRKGLLKAGGNPALITAYGAYGYSHLPRFRDAWISLIDRGFVYAIAHVRGGREKGSRWYNEGRRLKKRNSFTDFIAVTEALTAQGLADPKRVFAYGASAGGMLVGAVANMRPDLYAGIVAEVPAMDILTTMADPSLPLSTLEYGEWGNPAIERQYLYMQSYSPYDNVSAQAYPPVFVIAARYDSQVGVHEPAKWVARLRATKTDRKEILFMTNMSAGHGGTSGRFGGVNVDARVKAWLITLAQ